MNFDPRVVAPEPGAVIIPDEAVVEQEMLDQGDSYDQAEAEMIQASRELGDSGIEVDAANMVPQIDQDTGLKLAPPTPDQINDAKAAIAAAQGGTVTPSSPAPVGTLEQMQTDLADLQTRMAAIEQREALTNDAVTKLAAIEAVFTPSAPVTGPSGPAADADAIAGGQPVVEQQIATDQAANPS
jgi:hypothetical protein